MNRVFVTGIGTGVGKTVVSAALIKALGADYWKPIQAGNLEYSDSDRVRDLIGDAPSIIHPEQYRLKLPLSPHAAAAEEGIFMRREDFVLPDDAQRGIIVEGAGGVYVPIADNFLMIDLISQLNIPIILVVSNYLGSINHTLLSVDAIQRKKLPLLGVIFSGETVATSEDYIVSHTKLAVLGRIERQRVIDADVISVCAARFRGLFI